MVSTSNRVLITGAGGFIGSHLAEAAVRNGWDVTLFLRYSSQAAIGNLAEADERLLSKMRIVWGDITDPGTVADAVNGADSIVHLAALIGIPYSYAAPESYVAVNVRGTLNLLEAARAKGVRQTVLVSTSEVYGDAETPVIDETHPLKPQSPYAATKVAAEALARAYSCSFGVNVTVIRPFNTYGPRQSLRAVIPTIIGQALSQERIRLGSTWPRRDFTFVADTAAALLAAARMPELGLGPYNLGTGHSISIADLVNGVSRLLGRDLDVENDAARVRPPSGEVDRLTADNRRFQAATGWRPRTDLTEGLAETIEYFRKIGASTAASYRI
jgi:nucleoside-diphosphate-sugar epimerase